MLLRQIHTYSNNTTHKSHSFLNYNYSPKNPNLFQWKRLFYTSDSKNNQNTQIISKKHKHRIITVPFHSNGSISLISRPHPYESESSENYTTLALPSVQVSPNTIRSHITHDVSDFVLSPQEQKIASKCLLEQSGFSAQKITPLNYSFVVTDQDKTQPTETASVFVAEELLDTDTKEKKKDLQPMQEMRLTQLREKLESGEIQDVYTQAALGQMILKTLSSQNVNQSPPAIIYMTLGAFALGILVGVSFLFFFR
eukprot:gb/GECH01007318.1/.p1 GENE.gb/GECH01007318.1/~~gb/GECH01007318.1/.p1  ORF type:complete len:254 (+),score=44.01 gb/GECH01007318.1/:1-762(+)